MNATRPSLYFVLSERLINVRKRKKKVWKGREVERVFQVLDKVSVEPSGKVDGNGQGNGGCNPGRHGAESCRCGQGGKVVPIPLSRIRILASY